MRKYLISLVVLLALSLLVSAHHSASSRSDCGIDKATTDDSALEEHAYGLIGWPAGVTVWALLLTLVAIAEQATEARRSAEASQEGVEAALLNARAAIAADRPWITVEVTSTSSDYFQVVAKNCGRSPAEIISDHGEWQVYVNEDALPDEPPYAAQGMVNKYRQIIGPGETMKACTPLMMGAMRLGGPELIGRVESGLNILYQFGFVRYVSAIHKADKELPPYETRWCFQLLPAKPSLLVHGGKLAYNLHT